MKRYSPLSLEGPEKAKALMDVSLGKAKADLAVINGTLLNVYTGEYRKGCSVLVKGDWIAHVGNDPDDMIGPDTRVIDAVGRIVTPGLIDGHTHLADCLYRPAEFLRYAMRGGTTTIITETIEPFPVMGYEGIVDFLASLENQPVKIFATAPAMASTSTRSRGIPRKTMKKLLERDGIIGLGESYWQAVLQEPDLFLPGFEEALLAGKKLEGHSAGAKGRTLSAYIAAGISSCHEPITAEEVLERLRLGIHVMVREGSIRRDLDVLSGIKDSGIDLGRLILVTDGVGPVDLIEKGYMEYVVQKAIDFGLDPVKAFQMATINVAGYFQLDGLTGGIAPGRHADLLVIPDPETVRPEFVISMGRILAENGNLRIPPRTHPFSPDSLNSVHLPKRLGPSDFTISTEPKRSAIDVRVIDQVSELVTREFITSVPVFEGEIRSDPGRDLLKVAAVDRRFTPGKSFVGLVRGFRLRRGALACSSAWDTSDIIVVGAGEEDMAFAVNRIHELRGGAVLCSGGRVLSEIPMPLFGLMSDLPLPDLAARIRQFTKSVQDLGFPFDDPHRTLVTLTGAAIPFIRICEEGLVDIKEGKSLPLFVAN